MPDASKINPAVIWDGIKNGSHGQKLIRDHSKNTTYVNTPVSFSFVLPYVSYMIYTFPT